MQICAVEGSNRVSYPSGNLHPSLETRVLVGLGGEAIGSNAMTMLALSCQAQPNPWYWTRNLEGPSRHWQAL